MDLAVARKRAADRVTQTQALFRDAHKQWEQTEEGISRLATTIAAHAGLIDKAKGPDLKAANENVARVESGILAWQADNPSGAKIPAEMRQERKTARLEQKHAQAAALTPLHERIAEHMAAHPEKFGDSPAAAADINLAKPAHMAACLEVFKAQRRAGAVSQPEAATQMMHRLSTAASERAFRIELHDNPDGIEPMDTHHETDDTKIAYLMRMVDPDRAQMIGEPLDARGGGQHTHHDPDDDRSDGSIPDGVRVGAGGVIGGVKL